MMSEFNPVWRLKINSVDYSSLILANLSITSGRTDIYQQPVAGYINLSLINLDQTIYTFGINQSVTIELQDSTATFIPIFGGSITDIDLSVSQVGSVAYAQTYQITALGALARLPKTLFEDSLPQENDGDQIYEVLRGILLNQWQQVPGALTWATYDPATTWEDAENNGLGEIDRPGNYTLIGRTADPIDSYSLAASIALSGLGYLYESSTGAIGYADSTHRTTYLSTNGYIDLSAAQARAAGLTIRTRSGDVRNQIALTYGAGGAGRYETSDLDSIAAYGKLGQVFSTLLKNATDAESQGDFYLSLRANPQAIFDNITYDLTNNLIDDGDRNSLINVFMGMPLNISDLPLNMNAGQFLGFVEGWTWTASYNSLAIKLFVSPIAFSLQAMAWSDVPIIETWSSLNPGLDYLNATIVA
jgi:hypothetical protein